MKEYCHIYPTCPVCHEPHNNGSILYKYEFSELCEHCDECFDKDCKKGVYNLIQQEKEKRNSPNFVYERDANFLYKCSNCGTYFFNQISLDEYEKTFNLIEDNLENIEKRVPLIWDLNLNIIEKSYLEWLNPNVKGKFLITWPWNDVKFIPLLISEYALNFPNQKIVVLDYMDNIEDINNINISKPDMDSILNKLYFFDSNSNNELDPEIKRESNKFNKKKQKNILFKSKKIHMHLKLLNDLENNIEKDYSVDFQDYCSKITPGKIKEIIQENYNNDKIVRSVELEGFKPRKFKSENPLFDVKADYRLEWGGKPRFNTSNYWNILNNLNNLKSVKSNLNYTNVLSEEISEEKYKKQIFFIPLTNNNKFNIFKKIKDINPDLIICPNADDLIMNYRRAFNGIGYDFIKFLKNTDKTVLLFSTNKDSRHIYQELISNGNLPKNLTFHTWDTPEVINEIIKTQDINKSSNNSILSSSFDDIIESSSTSIKYIPLESLGSVENSLSYLYQILKDNNNEELKNIKLFFEKLISTPLYINDRYEPFTNFSFYQETFSHLTDHIAEEYEDKYEDIYKDITTPFNEIYKIDGMPFNPLIERIKNEIISLIEEDDNNIIVLIAPTSFYRKPIKRIFEDIFEEMSDKEILNGKFIVTSWDKLSNIQFTDNENPQIIATTYPYIDFNFYDNKFKNFTFVGSPNTIKIIEDKNTNRVSEKIVKPLIAIEDHEEAPILLKSILSELSDKISKLDILMNEFYVDQDLAMPHDDSEEFINNTQEQLAVHHMVIEKGEEIVLVINDADEGLFIPINHNITFKNKDDYSMDGLKVEKSNLQDLFNKEIIIDNHGFYSSYKDLFTKFMVENGKDIQIHTTFNTWIGFKDLINSTYSWLNIFRKLVLKREKDSFLPKNQAKDVIASIIHHSGINIGRNYIKNVWLSDPIEIMTNEGNVEIYEIDRPRNSRNLVKVYEHLNNQFDDINLTAQDALVTFSSALVYQKLRLNFLKNRDIPEEYKYLYKKFNRTIVNILMSSELFKVKNTKVVKLTKDVSPYKKIKEYSDYIN